MTYHSKRTRNSELALQKTRQDPCWFLQALLIVSILLHGILVVGVQGCVVASFVSAHCKLHLFLCVCVWCIYAYITIYIGACIYIYIYITIYIGACTYVCVYRRQWLMSECLPQSLSPHLLLNFFLTMELGVWTRLDD